jgi:hypothetical protein
VITGQLGVAEILTQSDSDMCLIDWGEFDGCQRNCPTDRIIMGCADAYAQGGQKS